MKCRLERHRRRQNATHIKATKLQHNNAGYIASNESAANTKKAELKRFKVYIQSLSKSLQKFRRLGCRNLQLMMESCDAFDLLPLILCANCCFLFINC